jgi:hypothetical protein
MEIVPLLKLCVECGGTMPRDGGARCAECAPGRRRAVNKRCNQRPQLRFWQSAEWRKVRAQVIERDGGGCVRYGSRENLTVHHTS